MSSADFEDDDAVVAYVVITEAGYMHTRRRDDVDPAGLAQALRTAADDLDRQAGRTRS